MTGQRLSPSMRGTLRSPWMTTSYCDGNVPHAVVLPGHGIAQRRLTYVSYPVVGICSSRDLYTSTSDSLKKSSMTIVT